MQSQKIFIPIILAIGVALFAWQVLLPAYDGVTVLVGEVNKVTAEIEKKNELFAALGNVVAVIEENRKKLEVATQLIIPAKAHKEEIIVVVEYLAKQNQMLINNMTLSEKVSTDRSAPATMKNPAGAAVNAYNPGTVGISISCSGSYENFKSFLQSLERTIRIADTDTVQFSKIEDGLGDFKITVTMYTQ